MAEKVEFITGAGSGLGRLAATRALAAGHAVAALDLDVQGLAALAPGPGRLLALPVDVADAAAVQAAVRRTEAELGPVTRVVHAAAIMPLGLLMQQKAELIHRVMAINYGGTVNVAHAVLPGMLQRGQGDFIGYASSAGHIPLIYMGAYDASKAAVCAFLEVLAHEHRASGIRWCCVCPPPVATPLLNQARSTVWPKMFDQQPALSADAVLDDVERALAQGEFWVFPSRALKQAIWLRRLAPGLLWKKVHQVEGR